MAAVSATIFGAALGSVAARRTATTRGWISTGGHSQCSLRDSKTVWCRSPICSSSDRRAEGTKESAFVPVDIQGDERKEETAVPLEPSLGLEPDLDIEDLDNEELEDLFETYGVVVREESVPAPTSSEVDDDAESLELAVALAGVANDVKASEIRVLCVKPLVYWTRFFVIATGFSRPQVDAIGQRMRNMAEERFKRTPKGDLKPNAWTLLDFGDVVVHIFYPKERSFYNLEEFYGNATVVELPFESQSQVL